MTFIADRLKRIKPSMTVGINVKANALRAEGKDVLVLAAGEPDFDTPQNIRNAASDAMDAGKTRYVPGKGTPDLQKAIQSKFLKDNNLNYDLDEIIVGVGGKHIIYNAMMATINPNDEVIIPAPFWVSYPDIVLLAEGKPVIVQCPENQSFKITADQLEENITDKTIPQSGLSKRMFTKYRYWENGLTGKNSLVDGSVGSIGNGTYNNKIEPENAILSYVGGSLSTTRIWKAYDDNLGKNNSENLFFEKLTTYSSPIKIIDPNKLFLYEPQILIHHEFEVKF